MLVQEFMVGVEYVVNCVSRDGEHKVVSLWRYDKVRGWCMHARIEQGELVYI